MDAVIVVFIVLLDIIGGLETGVVVIVCLVVRLETEEPEEAIITLQVT
jgi:hypothetical protein